MGAHSWGAEGWGVQDVFLDKECQTRKISPETGGDGCIAGMHVWGYKIHNVVSI